MEFSNEEMGRRLDTVRARMDAAGMDCLLITGIENFSYFVGVPISVYQSRRPWVALIPLKSEPIGIMKGPNSSSFTAQHNGFFKKFDHYSWPVTPNLSRKVAELISDLGAKRVGCELGLEMHLGLPVADFQAIARLVPQAEFVDASDVIWKLRMTKSPEEIVRLRKACEITSTSRQEVFRRVRPGMTEGDVADLWADLMHKAGGQGPFFMYINSGPIPDLLPTRDRKLQRGEVLWLDGGVYVGGYTCDFSRYATLGPATPRQIKIHQGIVEVFNLAFERIKPGVVISDLAGFIFTELERRGYPKKRDSAGHSMGMLINEPPMINPWNDLVLTEGLVFGMEWGGHNAPDGYFTIEQLVQVTKNGYDLLTPESMEMVTIDF